MAQTYDAVSKMAEGIVSWAVGSGIAADAQSLSFWLRALKENAQYGAKFITNDFVVDMSQAMTATAVEINAAASYVLGAIGWNKKTSAVVIDGFNKSTPTPGTDTSLYTFFKLYLAATSATTAPTINSAVWFPYLYFSSKYDVTACLASDDATGVTAAEAKIWSIRFNK